MIGTYLHGPLLPKNVWLADRLIELALGIELEPLPGDALEDAAHASARRAAGVERRQRRRAAEHAQDLGDGGHALRAPSRGRPRGACACPARARRGEQLVVARALEDQAAHLVGHAA